MLLYTNFAFVLVFRKEKDQAQASQAQPEEEAEGERPDSPIQLHHGAPAVHGS